MEILFTYENHGKKVTFEPFDVHPEGIIEAKPGSNSRYFETGKPEICFFPYDYCREPTEEERKHYQALKAA